MSENNKEKRLKFYPIPIALEKTSVILEQMKKCICKIIYKNGFGTGFFCHISYQNYTIPVLITNNHIINETTLKEKNVLNITLNGDKEIKKIKLFKNKKIYMDTKNDLTLIEINPEIDKIHNFLELDEGIFSSEKTLYETIYIPHYPKSISDKNIYVAFGVLNQLDDEKFKFFCNPGDGSSGSPILNISKNKVIGIYKEANDIFNLNKSCLFKKSLSECLHESNLIQIQNEYNISNENVFKIPEIEEVKLGPDTAEEENDETKGKDQSVKIKPLTELEKTILGPENEDEGESIEEINLKIVLEEKKNGDKLIKDKNINESKNINQYNEKNKNITPVNNNMKNKNLNSNNITPSNNAKNNFTPTPNKSVNNNILNNKKIPNNSNNNNQNNNNFNNNIQNNNFQSDNININNNFNNNILNNNINLNNENINNNFNKNILNNNINSNNENINNNFNKNFLNNNINSNNQNINNKNISNNTINPNNNVFNNNNFNNNNCINNNFINTNFNNNIQNNNFNNNIQNNKNFSNNNNNLWNNNLNNNISNKNKFQINTANNNNFSNNIFNNNFNMINNNINNNNKFNNNSANNNNMKIGINNSLNSNSDDKKEEYKNKNNRYNIDFSDNLNINEEINNQLRKTGNFDNVNENKKMVRSFSNMTLNNNHSNNNLNNNFMNNNYNNIFNNNMNQNIINQNINMSNSFNNLNFNNNNFNNININSNINNNPMNFNQPINNKSFNDQNDFRKRFNSVAITSNNSLIRYNIPSKTGFKDLGNTSYLNSVLHIFGSFEDFKYFFFNLNNQNKISQDIRKTRLLYLVYRLYMHLYPDPEKTEQEIYSPIYHLNYFNENNIKKNPNELFNYILKQLHKELNSLNKIENEIFKPCMNDINLFIETFNKTNNSLIVNTFNFFEIKESQCSKCNFKNNQYINLYTIEVDLEQSYNNIQRNNYNFLNVFNYLDYRKKDIEQEDKYCSFCADYELQLTTKTIYNFPKILVFSLDRGQLEPNLLKIPFCVEERINYLTNFVKNAKQYELIGIVSVYMRKQKYVCCCKSQVDLKWYYYEDEIVQNYESNIIIQNHNNNQYVPCLLVYQAIN